MVQHPLRKFFARSIAHNYVPEKVEKIKVEKIRVEEKKRERGSEKERKLSRVYNPTG